MSSPIPPSAPAASPRSTAGGNAVALGVSQVVMLATGLLVQIYLARFLGRSTYGLYGFLTGVVALFTFLSRMNLAVLLSREVARRPESAGPRLGLGLLTTVALGFVAGGAILLYVAVLDGRPAVVLAAAVASVALTATSLNYATQGVFQGLERSRPLVPAALAARAVLLVATIGLVQAGLGLYGVFSAQILSWLVGLAWLLAVFRRDIGPIPVRPSFSAMSGLVREASSFGLNNLFGSIYLAADLLILQAFRGESEVGLYRVAAILIVQLPMAAATLNMAMLPRVARHLGDPEGAGAELSFAVRVLLALSLPIAVGGICVARPLVLLMGSDAYRHAWVALVIMLPIIPLRYVNSTTGTALSALDHQPDRTRGVMWAAAINVVTNLVAIPLWGAAGAGLTTSITELWLTWYLGRQLAPLVRGLSIAGPLVRSGAASAGMAVLLLLTPGWPVLVRIAAGAALYAVLGLLAGAWHPDDLRRLRRI